MNTHRIYRDLRDAGMDKIEAEAIVKGINEPYKKTIEFNEKTIEFNNKVLQALNRIDLKIVKTTTSFETLRADINKELGDVSTEIHKQGNISIRWFIGIGVTLAILIVSLLRFFPSDNITPTPIQYQENVDPIQYQENTPIEHQENIEQPISE